MLGHLDDLQHLILRDASQALEQHLQQPRNTTSPGPAQGSCFPLESWFVLESKLAWSSSVETGIAGSSWQGQGLGLGHQSPNPAG